MNDDSTRPWPPQGADNQQLLTQLAVDVRALTARMTSLEEKVEARLYDTRPIWERVLAELTGLREGQSRMQEGLAGLSQEQAGFKGELAGFKAELARLGAEQGGLREELRNFRTETDHNLKLINRQLGILSKDFLRIRADQDDLDERVTQLEGQRG